MGYYEDAEAMARKHGMRLAPRDAPEAFIARTPGQLAKVVSERMDLLGLSALDVAERADLPESAVSRLAAEGEARLEDIYGVLDVLRLRPVMLPAVRTECDAL